jgi:Trypsin-like peptidase domain
VILDDGRKYIIPLFVAEADGNTIILETRRFLGTAFFVTAKGDAITAAHVIPEPSTLKSSERLIGLVMENGKETLRLITKAAVFDSFDVAIIRVDTPNAYCLPISDEQIHAGTDIEVIGIPSHEVFGQGKEMRFLKGHVTFVHKRLELNFAIPAGMSGAPVFVNGKVVAYATGRVRSESIEEQTEEVLKLTNSVEQIRIHTTSSVVYYGTAYPFDALRDLRDPVLEGKTLLEFIANQNR